VNAFWDDLARDLKDPEFKAAFMATWSELAEDDQ
jgi:hypothetical protein